MKFRFSLRMLLVAITLACIAVFLCVKYWPRHGAPNLIVALVDSKGNPVADATISIHDCHYLGFSPTPRYKATTDHRGEFRFESVELSNIPPHIYVDRDSDQFEDAYFHIEVKHDTHFLKRDVNQPSHQSVNLIKDFDHVFELEMSLGGVVSGRLTNESGVPIANTTVRLVCRSLPRYVQVFTTDQTGQFQTFALPPAVFDVELNVNDVEKLGLFKKIDGWELEWSSEHRSNFFKFAQVRIKAGQTIKLDHQFPLRLRTTGTSDDDSN